MMNVSAQQLNAWTIPLLAGCLSRPSTLMPIVQRLISYLIFHILILQFDVFQMQCEIHDCGDGAVIDWVVVKRVDVVFALVVALVASFHALHYASLDPDPDLAYALALAHMRVRLPVLGSKEEF